MKTIEVTLWSIAEQRSGTNDGTVDKRFFPQGVEIVTGSESGTYTYRTDHLGSIREIIDDQGDLTARFDYSPWGEIDTVSGSFDLDFGFTGHFIHQPTGLYLAPFRAYDAGLGRWLSRDPLSWAEFLPEGPNLYGYVGNNPINSWDALGLMDSVTMSLPQMAAAGLTAQEIAQITGISMAVATALVTAHKVDKAVENAQANARGKDPCERARDAVRQMRKGIENARRTIQQHRDKIANPTAHIEPGYNPEWAINTWNKQIESQQRGLEIMEKALDKLENAAQSACRKWYNPSTW